MTSGPHRRLPADEARQRILEAAERRLSQVGPEGLRLQELAKDLGISHPAILHHFGSREGLVQAVVERAVGALHADLIGTFATTLADAKGVQAAELLHRIAETLADRGQARLIAWLILSKREPPELSTQVRLRRVVEGAHAFRKARSARSDLELGDTAFIVELTAFALLGDAVFGERMRKLEGLSREHNASRDFRVRLARLLEAQLLPRAEPQATKVAEPQATKVKRVTRAKRKPAAR
jgi:AcrR family transcriptional regulator